MVRLLQWLTRIAGVLALLLGVLIGRVGLTWLPRLHITLGLVVVVALALVAISGLFARLKPALPVIALVWAGATAYIGYTQTGLVTGGSHWIVEVLHALLGLGAIGLGDAIGARISRQRV
jgi:hypothetical protein